MAVTQAVLKRGKAKSQKRTLFTDIMNNRDKYLMLFPYMSLFFVFVVIPVVGSIFLSFTSFNMLEAPRFVGWQNYIRLFLDDDIFIIAVRNTLVFALITGPISYFACLFLAWMINEFPPKIRSILTIILYAPSVSGTLFVIWAFVFSGDAYGLINGLLMKTGIIYEPIQWLIDPKYTLTIIIIVQLWASLGTSFLALIAGLQSIDTALYEAGEIDGIKNRFQELIYITLPSMGPQLAFAAVMQIGVSFAVSGISMTLAGFPSTDYAAHTIVTHIIDYGTVRFEMGYASAIATVLFISMVGINTFIRSLLSRFNDV